MKLKLSLVSLETSAILDAPPSQHAPGSLIPLQRKTLIQAGMLGIALPMLLCPIPIHPPHSIHLIPSLFNFLPTLQSQPTNLILVMRLQTRRAVVASKRLAKLLASFRNKARSLFVGSGKGGRLSLHFKVTTCAIMQLPIVTSMRHGSTNRQSLDVPTHGTSVRKEKPISCLQNQWTLRTFQRMMKRMEWVT